MIQFNCHCSYRFEVPQDQAGGLIQCPQCGRLNDVPTLSDIVNLDDDGIYKLDNVPEPPHQTLDEAHRIYTRSHVDDTTGEEIDLRPSADEILAAGTTAIPMRLADDAATPKYDPETGELIEPLVVNQLPRRGTSIDDAKIPVAKRALAYAGKDAERILGPRDIPRELLRPMNLMVMFIVLIAYLAAAFANLLLVVPSMITGIRPVFLNPIIALIISHYGNTVDEIGTERRDEIPRPLRNLSFFDDVVGPFVRWVVAIMYCYFPMLMLKALDLDLGLLEELVYFSLSVAGSFFFPAVWLTTLTSGTTANLRPDRVMGVITSIGPKYLWLCLLWMASAVLTLWAFAGPGFIPMRFLGYAAQWLANWKGIHVFSITGSIYGMHLLAWQLGLIYRTHHHIFPWVMQRHVSTRKDTARILEARRREAAIRKQLEKNRPDRDARLQEIRNPPPPPTRTG